MEKDYEVCNWCKFKRNCDHAIPYPAFTIPRSAPMNTYTVEARAYYDHTYIVEAESEDDAVARVEEGYLDPETTEFTGELEDTTVVDVEYGDVEYRGKLGVTIVVRGPIDEGNIRDAAYQLLQRFDGITTEYDGAELELIGFSVEHIEEA
jgi:hypothetical protein